MRMDFSPPPYFPPKLKSLVEALICECAIEMVVYDTKGNTNYVFLAIFI